MSQKDRGGRKKTTNISSWPLEHDLAFESLAPFSVDRVSSVIESNGRNAPCSLVVSTIKLNKSTIIFEMFNARSSIVRAQHRERAFINSMPPHICILVCTCATDECVCAFFIRGVHMCLMHTPLQQQPQQQLNHIPRHTTASRHWMLYMRTYALRCVCLNNVVPC